MIRRYPPRPSRRQHQDFHFFAAPDPTANLESQFARPAPIPAAASDAKAPADAPEPPAPSTRTIVTLIGPGDNTYTGPREPQEPSPATPAGKPRPKLRTQKRASTARLATPRRNRPEPARQPSPAPQGRSHHERHCAICSHRERADIESDFIEWCAPDDIADEYKVSRSAIYRHARAAGLFHRRNRNLRFALGRLIQSVDYVEPTADSIVRAIHAFARINDEGEWVEPPAHVIVSSGGIRREAAAPPGRRPIAMPLDSQTISDVIDVTPDPALPVAPDALLREGVVAGALPETINREESDATR